MSKQSPTEPPEVMPRDYLRQFVDSQTTVVELIASNASLERTLDEIVGQCETTWRDSIALILLAGARDEEIPVSRSLPSEHVPAVVLAVAEATQKWREPESEPQVLHFGLDPAMSVELSFAAATVVPIFGRGPLLGSITLLASSDSPLSPSELAVLQRYAQLARISIEQHQSELHLHRLIAEERQRLAGILHDDPIQAMTAVSLRMQRLARHAPPESIEMVEELQRSVADAIDRMRRLLIEMHPPTLDDEGLVSAIDLYFAEVLEPLDLTCVLHEEVLDEPTIETASLAYRLISEALWNVAKHAQATCVEVQINAQGGAVDAVIIDDGVGFDNGRSHRTRVGHMGLSACRELADRASGSWSVESSPGAGTTVSIHLPGTKAISGPARLT